MSLSRSSNLPTARISVGCPIHKGYDYINEVPEQLILRVHICIGINLQETLTENGENRMYGSKMGFLSE